MPFYEQVPERQNQIGIHPKDVSSTTALAGKGLGALVSGFVAAKQDSVIEAHINDMSAESDRLAAAMKQGTISPTEYYTRLNVRQREFAANHPQYAEEARKRLVEALGSVPTAVSAQAAYKGIDEQQKLEDIELEHASQIGVRVSKPDGSTDKNASIKNFREVMQAKQELEAAKGMTEGGFKLKEAAVDAAFKKRFNAGVIPILQGVNKVLSESGGSNNTGYAKALEGYTATRNQFMLYINEEVNKTDLPPESRDAIIQSYEKVFKSFDDGLFSNKDTASAKNRANIVQHVASNAGVEMVAAAPGLFGMMDKMGDSAGGALFNAVLQSKPQLMTNFATQLDTGLNTLNANNAAVVTQDTADAMTSGAVPSGVSPERQKNTANTLYKITKQLSTAPNLTEKDAKSFANAANALTDLTHNNGTFEDKQNLVNALNRPSFYTQLEKVVKNPETKNEGIKAANTLTALGVTTLADQAREAISELGKAKALGSDVFPVTLTYNADKGMFSMDVDKEQVGRVDAATKKNTSTPLSETLQSGSGYQAYVRRTLKPFETRLNGLNSALELTVRTQRLSGNNTGTDLEFKQGLIMSLGLPANVTVTDPVEVPTEVMNVFTSKAKAKEQRYRVRLNADGDFETVGDE